MNSIQALILATIEGVTEFLPISSTGHLILASKLLAISQNEFTKTFEIFIQLGAILSVALLYGKILFVDKNLLAKTLVAFMPTGVVGLVLYKFIKNFLIGNVDITLVSLLAGGGALVLIELYLKKNVGLIT